MFKQEYFHRPGHDFYGATSWNIPEPWQVVESEHPCALVQSFAGTVVDSFSKKSEFMKRRTQGEKTVTPGYKKNLDKAVRI